MALEGEDKKMMRLFVAYFIERLEKKGDPLPAAELEVIRKLLQDNAITFASVRAGDFGQVAKEAAEEFPFNPDGSIRGDTVMGVEPKKAH